MDLDTCYPKELPDLPASDDDEEQVVKVGEKRKKGKSKIFSEISNDLFLKTDFSIACENLKSQEMPPPPSRCSH